MAHKEVLPTPLIKSGQGVWTFFAETIIKAPATQVYEALRDFQSYSKWNKYMPSIKTPSGSNAVAEGDMITLAYRPEPTGSLEDIPCRISKISDAEMELCWQGCAYSIPTFLLLPDKVQKVIPKGDNECVIQIWETMAGPLAYVVRWRMGQKLTDMTEGVVDGLKTYVEGSNTAKGKL